MSIVVVPVLSDEDIDGILCTAFDGNYGWSNRWAIPSIAKDNRVEYNEKYPGKRGYEVVPLGGTLKIRDTYDDNNVLELTREKFLEGFALWYKSRPTRQRTADPAQIDGPGADAIVQIALFGKVDYD